MEEKPLNVSSTETTSSIVPAYDPNSLFDLLPIYYKRLFPHKQFYNWISYGGTKSTRFTNREFSFTLIDDIYLRYLSFENQNEFEKELYAKNPVKIDIGPVMNVRPREHRLTSKMIPVEKELVFDIDMTDYDDVRTCCSGADVCTKCWKFMTIACKVIDQTLREDFNFEDILWVFSGRRGIHCWVCDQPARVLDSKARSSIAEYIDIIISSGEGSRGRVVIIEKMHHSVKRALKIIEPYFEEICLQDQDMFGNPERVKKLLSYVTDDTVRKEIDEQLKRLKNSSSKDIWNMFQRVTLSFRGGPAARKLRFIIEEIKLALLYPRIDINVTKGFNHLLKAPFCVHPKTGKICVPFSSAAAHKFDPTTVPTINDVLEDVNEFDLKMGDDCTQKDKARIKDYKKTKMLKGVIVFDEFLRKMEIKKPKQNADETMEF